jgi:hypothetical protein
MSVDHNIRSFSSQGGMDQEPIDGMSTLYAWFEELTRRRVLL